MIHCCSTCSRAQNSSSRKQAVSSGSSASMVHSRFVMMSGLLPLLLARLTPACDAISARGSNASPASCAKRTPGPPDCPAAARSEHDVLIARRGPGKPRPRRRSRCPARAPTGSFISTGPPSVGTDNRLTERGLPRRHWQRDRHVAPVDLELPMRSEVHLQIQVACWPAAETRPALARPAGCCWPVRRRPPESSPATSAA